MDHPTAAPRRPDDIELVIFDCDGVLVDSEPITNRVLAQMINELGIPMTMPAWAAELKAIRGIETVLDALESRNIPFCVASSSSHHEMRTTLGLTGLLPRFENRLFSVTEVPAAKPAPDVYLFAASRYATAPSKCCVVEDSTVGVKAAAAAGMRVYGYCELTPRDRLTAAGAHFTVTNMPELLEVWFSDARRC